VISYDNLLAFGKKRKTDETQKHSYWIDFQGLERLNFPELIAVFSIHPLTLEDCLQRDPLEKYEIFSNYLHVSVLEMRYKDDSNILEDHYIGIVVFPHLVLTFHRSPTACLSEVQTILGVYDLIEDFKKGEEVKPAYSGWVLYCILDLVTQTCANLVTQVAVESRALDELILLLSAHEQGDLLRRIGMARAHSANLRYSLQNKTEILTELLELQSLDICKKIHHYLHHTRTNVERLLKRLRMGREVLDNLHSTYLAKASLDVSEASNDVNLLMKKFGAFAAIFVPLSLVAGMWGMNVRVPGQNGSSLWFFGISGSMVSFILVMLLVYKKLKVM